MRITRRQFLKGLLASAAVLGLSRSDLLRLQEALAGAGSPPVIWLQASGCTGCSVSLLNWIDAATGREIDEVLLEDISLKYHPTVMAAAGQLAVDTAKNARATYSGSYILVVEGAVPTGQNGNYCHVWEDGGTPYTAHQAVLNFAASAAGILAVGTCASFGGIPAAGTNPTAASGVASLLPKADANKVINLAGCPPHPDWMMGTIVHILLGDRIRLDSNRRPTEYYGSGIHPCYRKRLGKATDLGQLGCFLDVGCRRGNCDIPTRGWNNGMNWCVRANTPCIGCTDPSFPGGTFYTV
jgi:hydrogenase small subunit